MPWPPCGPCWSAPRPARRQLSLLPSALCGADAQTAAPGGAGRLRPGHAVNPNNHARDGGRASSEMEIEAVSEIAAMFGWKDQFLGHLTSSGTIANLEALWVAGRCAEGPERDQDDAGRLRERAPKRILASDQAHYTHSASRRCCGWTLPRCRTDDRGRMDLAVLEDELRKGDVGDRRSHVGHDGDRSRRSASGDPGSGAEIRFARARGRGLRRLFQADSGSAGRTSAAGISPSSIRPTRLSSIRTNTACNPTAAAASSSATPAWAGFTSTTRPIRTSLPASCTWARSAWSARARARQRWRCGQRSSCCRWCQAANLRRGLSSRPPRRAGTRPARPRGPRFVPLAAGQPELDIVVWKAASADAGMPRRCAVAL